MATSAPSRTPLCRGFPKWSTRKATRSLRSKEALLPLDGGADGVAPLRPGAVVVADVALSEEVVEHKPRVAGALPDAPVGDALVAPGEARLALVDLPELVGALDRKSVV